MKRALFALLVMACGPASYGGDAGNADAGSCAPIDLALGDAERSASECTIELLVPTERVVEIWADGATLSIEGVGEGASFGPARWDAGAYAIAVHGRGVVRVRDHGAPAGEIRRERALVWTDPAIVDDAATVGLARLVRAAANGQHGGLLLDQWFRRFATTAHSERLGPQTMLEQFAATHGTDPRAWDLDAFPFRVTAVHNRLDRADDTHCGELRVSLASIDPLLAPFHLIFLFRQPATARDLGPDGRAHCTATALRWARLGDLDEAAFLDAARAMLDEAITHERFLVAESVELLVSPWEWRQWFLQPNDDPALPEILDNHPLFETVDTERLNRDGADRDAFLAWVESNADALAARRMLIPDAFRSPSARVNDGVPWIPLDLSGVDPTVLAGHPSLRQEIEIVGCPACHATDAHFVQTLPDRTFSPFYDKELVARATYLANRASGIAEPAPFGPLQAMPLLPP